MFQDAEPLNAVAAGAGVDFLPRRLTAKGSEVAVTARLTLVVSADTVVSVAYYTQESGGSVVATGSLNDGAALVGGQLYSFEIDLAKGQWINAQAAAAVDVTGSVTILGQP